MPTKLVQWHYTFKLFNHCWNCLSKKSSATLKRWGQ